MGRKYDLVDRTVMSPITHLLRNEETGAVLTSYQNFDCVSGTVLFSATKPRMVGNPPPFSIPAVLTAF